MITKFYDSQKLLNYNALMNFVLGARSVGKTHHFKLKGLKKFIKNKEQFIYVRRTQTELDELDKEKFFTTTVLSQAYPDFKEVEKKITTHATKLFFKTSLDDKIHEMTITTRKIMIDGNIVCYLKALSTWLKLKGSEYDEVTMIMFDEVLIETNSGKNYLPNEVEKLFNLIYSIKRDRKNLKVFMLSNSTNTNNPYFNYFNFTQTGEKEFYNLKDFSTVIQFSKLSPLNEETKDDDYFKLIHKSKIYDSVVNNEFQINKNDNIIKLKGEKTRLYSINCNGFTVTLYACGTNIYVSQGHDINLNLYTFNLENISNNCYYLNRSSSIAKSIRKNFYQNNIYYDSLNTKFCFSNEIQNIL